MRPLIFLLFSGNILCAQNLVVNPGFELCASSISKEKDTIVYGLSIPGWNSPTDGTPDYCYLNQTEEGSKTYLPGNMPDPFEGNAYARFWAFDNYEYLRGTFSEPLQAGITYTVSITVAIQFEGPDDLKQIGIYFPCDSALNKKGRSYPRLLEEPQILLNRSKKVGRRQRWYTYESTYIAKGNETSFIIGRFSQGNSGTGFYCVDSVSVSSGEHIFKMTNVHFETGTSVIQPQSYPTLDSIATVLEEHPLLKVAIFGYADTITGDANANKKLSEERAKAIGDFFIAKGIDTVRITVSGGESSTSLGDDKQKECHVAFRFYK